MDHTKKPDASRILFFESANLRAPILPHIIVTQLTFNNNCYNANSGGKFSRLQKKGAASLLQPRLRRSRSDSSPQTKVSCHNFAEEDFRDFLFPGTNVDSLADPSLGTSAVGSMKSHFYESIECDYS